MSDPIEISTSLKANFELWEHKAHDKQTADERMASEVFLAALGQTITFRRKIFLKGGVLVGAIYQSGRNTADLDFSTTLTPDHAFLDALNSELTKSLPSAAAALGSPDTLIRIQSVEYRPRKSSFTEAKAPAISVKFAYAQEDTDSAKKLRQGRSNNIIYADISFNEPIGYIQKIDISDSGMSFYAYSKTDLIAEKFRAILQQVARNRNRRQDVYDIWFLIGNTQISNDEKQDIYRIFHEKCIARDISPTQTSLDDPEVRARSQKEWETLKTEVETLPEFDECFEQVNTFYKSMFV